MRKAKEKEPVKSHFQQWKEVIDSIDLSKKPKVKEKSIDERIESAQRTMDAHEKRFAESGDIQDIKEAYYYKGVRNTFIAIKNGKIKRE